MKKLYVVRLTVKERNELKVLVNTGRGAAYRRTHAQWHFTTKDAHIKLRSLYPKVSV